MVLRPELIPKFLFEDSLKVGEEITRMPRPRLIFIIFIFVPNFPQTSNKPNLASIMRHISIRAQDKSSPSSISIFCFLNFIFSFMF